VNTTDNIDNLIAKVLSGEASDQEVAELESWKSASAENLVYFDHLVKLFMVTAEIKKDQTFNTDIAWGKLKSQIENRKAGGRVRSINPGKTNFSFIRIAAMLIIVAGVGYGIYKVLMRGAVSPVIVSSGNDVKEMKLPDSSLVVMNQKTELVYSFSDKKRSVELKGEAFFDLAQGDNRPFEVLAAGLVIKDIGTSFNVNAQEGNDSLIVQVHSGVVMMTSQTNQSVVLKKGEEMIYIKSRDEFIKSAVSDTNALAYKTKIFVFENASLGIIVQKLNEIYASNIILAGNLKSCRLTVTFKNENPDSIVDIIAETLQLTVTGRGDTLFLEGTGCEE